LIAACGSGRSTSVIPAVPAAWSVTTIAFIVRPLCRVLALVLLREDRQTRTVADLTRELGDHDAPCIAA
jgi:hypothetical protein